MCDNLLDSLLTLREKSRFRRSCTRQYARTKRKSEIGGNFLGSNRLTVYNYSQRKISILIESKKKILILCADIISMHSRGCKLEDLRRRRISWRKHLIFSRLEWSHFNWSRETPLLNIHLPYVLRLSQMIFKDIVRSNADDTFQVVILSSFDLLCKSTVRRRIANGAVE